MQNKTLFVVWRVLSAVLLLTMFAVQVPQPVYAAAAVALASDSGTLLKNTNNPLGTLAFPAELDADNDPGTNPSALTPVPVWRVRTPGPTQGTAYGQLLLGVVVQPNDPRTNPIRTLVTFHLWNPALGLDIVRVVESDVWGAATLEVPLDDLHLSGEFLYQASAEGYGETPVRSFSMDTTRSAGETLFGAASLKAEVSPDGLLTVQVESQIPWAAASPLPVSIRVTRLSPVADSQDVAMEIYPFLMAQPLDDRRARAEIYLDPGTYALMAQVDLDGGTRQAVSEMQTIVIESSAPPPVAYVEAIDESSIFGDSALVQYRAPDGSLALVRRSITDLPQTRPQPSQQGIFTQTRRMSAFRWDTRTYEMKVQTISDDGKKIAALTDFHYDPIARTYHIQINSLMDVPVEDTMTLQALGPNGVVIYEETVPILLDPAAPLEYDFQVPTKFGEVYGLRVIVHDPLSLEFLFTPVTNIGMAVANSLNPGGLKLAFNFGFEISLKLLNINLFVFGTNCLDGNCTTDKKGLMVEDSSNWATTVQNGIIDYLRDNFQQFAFAPNPLQKILEEIINGFTLELGAGAFVLRFGINGIVQLYDPACQNPESRAAAKAYTDSVGAQLDALTQMLTFRFKQQSERFQRDAPKVPFPGPLAAFLALKFTSVIAFKLEGGTQGDFGIRLTFFLEVGPKLAVVLTLPRIAVIEVLRLATFITKFVTLVQTISLVKNAVQIIRDGVTNAPARSACPKPPPGNGGGDDGGGDDPPPPNGSPDDRRDPVFENYLRTPQGSSGRIQELEQFVQLAQQRSFTRAETYFNLLLARERYSQAQAAVTEDLDRALQLQALTDATTERMQGIISGTIPITAGLTITDALAIEYENFTAELENTPGARELQQLADDAAFAERRYQELAGQELELQHEIANLFDRTAGLGVLDSGLTRWTVAAMGSVGVFAQPVRLFAGMRSNVPNSRVYTPFTAPPVLIVPTGGLYRLRNSQLARTWLDDYVANGGTLLVLAQARDEDWQMLPGGEVRGVGYFNDILCRQASVRVANTSEWLYGIGRDLPDIQLDGSFTAYPQNTRVLLVRTTGNQMPAMIEYTYGNGKVLATSTYPDFYINGMQSSEDSIFARSFFGQAYLLANHQQSAAEAAAPNTTVTVPLTVTTGASGLGSLTLWRDYFSDQAAESWRWGAHREDWARQGIRVDLSPALPPTSTQSVPVTFTAPQVAGLFRVGFIHGLIPPCPRYNWGSGLFIEYCPPPPKYVLPGSFYRVASLTFPNPPENALTPSALSYAYGETAILTATLSNPSPAARSITLQPVGGLDDTAPVTLNLPAGGSAARLHAICARNHLRAD